MSGPAPRLGNPLALFASSTPWAAAGYVSAGVALTGIWFGLALAALVVGAVTSVLVIGLPVLVLGLGLIRILADIERIRLPQVLGGPLRGQYRPDPAGAGWRSTLTRRLSDAQSWRDVVQLIVLWPVLFVIDLVGLVVWLVGWALVSLPFWYRFPPTSFDDGTQANGVTIGYYPNGPDEGPHYGFFIADLHSALIAAGIGLAVVVLVGNYVVSGCARLHAAIARGLLGGAYDPLEPARQMLVRDPELQLR